MASAVTSTVISDATSAFKLLNGVICIYKPSGWKFGRIQKELKNKLSTDLEQLQPPPRKERLEIRRIDESSAELGIPLENERVICSIPDGPKRIEVVKGLSFSDHPGIVGRRFRFEDFKMMRTGKIGQQTSGVHVLGLQYKGIRQAQSILHSRWLTTFLVSGRFGIATDTFFHTGKVLEKATYGKIHRQMFERLLAIVQSNHQRLSFMSSGVPLESQQAYELASQGLVRPAHATAPMIYATKCMEFSLPEFTIEVKAINADEKYLMQLIHELGFKLHSAAVCTKLQCTNVGPFGIDDALLFKHWNAENLINNMQNSAKVLKDFSLRERDFWVGKPVTQEQEHISEPE